MAARTPKLLCGGERVLQRRSECEIMGLKAAENDSGGQMSVCRRSESLGKTLCSRMMKTACRSQRRCREMRCDGSSGWICSRFNPADYRCGVISAWAITLFLMELFLPRLTRSATYWLRVLDSLWQMADLHTPALVEHLVCLAGAAHTSLLDKAKLLIRLRFSEDVR